MQDEVEQLLMDFWERNKRYPTVEEVERMLVKVKRLSTLSKNELKNFSQNLLRQFEKKKGLKA